MKKICDEPLDSSLTDNINDFFRKGMDEEQYAQMIKDENMSRLVNCESLITVKCNKLSWGVCQTSTQFIDNKLQIIETSVIKGSILIAKALHQIAKIEN